MGIKNFDGNVNADYLKETAVMLQNLKERSYECLGLSQGEQRIASAEELKLWEETLAARSAKGELYAAQ